MLLHWGICFRKEPFCSGKYIPDLLLQIAFCWASEWETGRFQPWNHFSLKCSNPCLLSSCPKIFSCIPKISLLALRCNVMPKKMLSNKVFGKSSTSVDVLSSRYLSGIFSDPKRFCCVLVVMRNKSNSPHYWTEVLEASENPSDSIVTAGNACSHSLYH